jgi:hypothetical protein
MRAQGEARTEATEVLGSSEDDIDSRFGPPRGAIKPLRNQSAHLLTVRDELQEGSIWIPEVDRNAAAASARPWDRTEFDFHSMGFEVVHGLINWAHPFKTEIASTGRNRNLGQGRRLDTRAV